MLLRFYLPSSGAADVSPSFGSGWDGTASGDRLKCVTTRINSAMTRKLYPTIGAATPAEFVLNRQYVSAPLVAGTLSGTVKGQIRCGRTAGVGTLAVQILVVSNDGSTVRGTALSVTASQLTSTPPRFEGSSLDVNRKLRDASDNTSITLSSVVVQAGDRLVIELGCRELASSGLNNAHTFGDNSGTDLPEDETTSTANNPWVEFSSCPALQ